MRPWLALAVIAKGSISSATLRRYKCCVVQTYGSTRSTGPCVAAAPATTGAKTRAMTMKTLVSCMSIQCNETVVDSDVGNGVVCWDEEDVHRRKSLKASPLNTFDCVCAALITWRGSAAPLPGRIDRRTSPIRQVNLADSN